MLELNISGFGTRRIEHLVLDYNGTIALDGLLVEGAAQAILELAGSVTVHVLTADTHGHCRKHLAGLPVTIHVLDETPEDVAKQNYLRSLGPEKTACLGNGANDRLMLEEAAVGVAVLGEEGAASKAIGAADLVAPGTLSALGLFLKPLRIVAGLRT